MKDTTLSKLGGTCSILAGVTLVVVGVGLLLSPPDQQIDPSPAVAFVQTNS
jgi:hypothetical protein